MELYEYQPKTKGKGYWYQLLEWQRSLSDLKSALQSLEKYKDDPPINRYRIEWRWGFISTGTKFKFKEYTIFTEGKDRQRPQETK